MIRPDYREIKHSAKGSTWHIHKYIIKDQSDEEWSNTLENYGDENEVPKEQKGTLAYHQAVVSEQVKDVYHNNMYCRNNIYYLSHGGPGSGRYPLGSGDRPYQKFEGSSGRRGGIRGYIQSRKQKKREIKEQKIRSEELRKRLEEEYKKKEYSLNKEETVKKGTATDVMKYQGELTNQQLREAAERIRLENELRGYSAKEMQTAMDKLDKIMTTIQTGTRWAKIGTDTYNTFAAIYNATPEGQKKPLTIVGKGGSDKKKQQ